MYLFSRTARLAPGKQVDGTAWAVEVTQKVAEILERPVSLWSSFLSPEFGRLVWSSFAEDLATFEANADALVADKSYLKLLTQAGDLLAEGVDDRVSQIVYGDTSSRRDAQYVSVVQAVTSPGQIAHAMTVGVAIAQYAEKVTGDPTLFTAPITGPYGSVMWVTPSMDIGSMDRGNTALNADPGWIELIDREAAGAYQEDAAITQQRIYRRLV